MCWGFPYLVILVRACRAPRTCQDFAARPALLLGRTSLAVLFLLLLRLPLLILLQRFLRVVVEDVAAPGAADVVGFTLVAHLDRPPAAADDALRAGVRTL